MSVYHLDCCTNPDHFVHHGEDGFGHRWQCRSCHMWWTPGEYLVAAEHDEKLERQEREYFEYGQEEVRKVDENYDTECWPEEVFQ